MATKLKDLIEAGLLKVDEPIQIYFRTGNRRHTFYLTPIYLITVKRFRSC
jgi:hypothetical protein